MTHVHVHDERVVLNSPVLVEGLPGLGLVGKIAADHLIDELEMRYYASVECPGLPPVAAYRDGGYEALPPVRIYADEERNLLALKSDVPIPRGVRSEFAGCVSQFVVDRNALPVYVSGRPPADDGEDRGELAVSGIATGTAARLLQEADISPPTADGVWRGPTGALLDAARSRGLDAVGLAVEVAPNEPNPRAACRMLEKGIAPIAGFDAHAEVLQECAAEIREQRRGLAEAMEAGGDESSRAEPLRMYQ
ncbi:3-isopropylmalate dehydratase [Halobacteriales archaeon QS_1_68_20]|nr:MAG: 3-isopropylmalate dehydratase [Halobacteriales archaeon QS_1_68_20]